MRNIERIVKRDPMRSFWTQLGSWKKKPRARPKSSEVPGAPEAGGGGGTDDLEGGT
jgi:hypothetical protein